MVLRVTCTRHTLEKRVTLHNMYMCTSGSGSGWGRGIGAEIWADTLRVRGYIVNSE